MYVMMLENCCYSRLLLMGYHVAEQGLFGELVHCDGGYHHYFPEEELFAVKKNEDGISHYRLTDYIHRNCETYPTHELGPLSEMSIANGGEPVGVPDFTKGKWMKREPITEGKYCLDKVCEDKNVKIVQ